MPMPHISLVIPAYNEATHLPHLLDSVTAARHRYRHGPDAIQVIVADNRSSDQTPHLAAKRGCTVVPVRQRIIAAARNGGAAAARAPILAFIDADSRIHPETFNGIADALARAEIVAGSTGVTFPEWRLGIVMTVAFCMPFVWWNRMDSGVVFCRRKDFLTIGGYNESMQFAEDLRFLADLRALGRPRKQRLTRIPRYKAQTSDRKFRKYGDWHFLKMVFKILWWTIFNREKVAQLADRYWYKDR